MWWIFGGKIHLSVFPRKNSLNICHQNFTTFFTLKFTLTTEICHLVLALGAISRNEASQIRETLCESGRCIDAFKKRRRFLKRRGRVLKKRGRVLKKVCGKGKFNRR